MPELKKVNIIIDSTALGDTLAWMPYVEEYRKKHKNCLIVCSLSDKWISLFDMSYPDIKLVGFSTHVEAEDRIIIGHQKNVDGYDARLLPLQKYAALVLGLDFKEIRPKVDTISSVRPVQKKYICIGTQSTAQAKYWNHMNGWQVVVDFVKHSGYEVICLDQWATFGNYPQLNKIPTGVIDRSTEKNGVSLIEDRVIDLRHSELFIGLSSGLSWLAWAVGVPVVMISGFSKPHIEFQSGVSRIHNPEVCNGCSNDLSFKFDRSDWGWCPVHRNTKKEYECTKSICPHQVILEISKILSI